MGDLPDIDDDAEGSEPNIRRALRRIERGVAVVVDNQRTIEQISRTEERVLAAVSAISTKVDAIDRALHGEKDGRTGLVARVTALEAAQQSRTAIVVAALSALSAVVAAGIAAWMAMK